MKDALEDFRGTVEGGAERLLALSEREARRRRGGGEDWSAKEIVGHLIDSAANNHRRFVLAQLKDDLIFEGYAQEDWVRVQTYADAPWAGLVELWRAYNLHLAHVMASAPEETLKRARAAHSLDRIAFHTVGASQPATLEYLMRDYIDHLKHHLAQILTAKAGLN
ncbi:MAG: DinB family protein [Acidobacteria bacterium]|nr:DinB family protein [Acidobacteriota bacterium]MCA1640661.1 DinB family protein [Acidobacteriota bacterium]